MRNRRVMVSLPAENESDAVEQIEDALEHSTVDLDYKVSGLRRKQKKTKKAKKKKYRSGD